MRFLRSRRGQIVIPSLLMFPSLFLFVYLIYETAKLSREKIRHQFAIDASAFVEMTNYSDFLNRTAYVNGAFPMRIFNEGYWDFQADCEGKQTNGTCNQKSYAKLLFDNGAYPYVGGSYINNTQLPSNQFVGTPGKWNIEYDNSKFSKRNQNPPDLSRVDMGDISTEYELFSENDSDAFWHSFEIATEIYKLYVQIYSLLGSVESAQFQVLHRLTGGSTKHSFMQKSYWLNTGDPIGDATVLATTFDVQLGDFEDAMKANCQQRLDYWGNRKGGNLQPLVPQHVKGGFIDLASPGTGCQSSDKGPGGGLFQIETLTPSMFKTLTKTGITIQMHWAIPNTNYFQVPFNDLMEQSHYAGQELHTTVKLDTANDAAAVWPDPTPKFQVRQLP